MLYLSCGKSFQRPRVFGPHRPWGAVFILQRRPHLVNSFLPTRKVYFPSSDNSTPTPLTGRSRWVNSSASAYSIVTA